MSIIKTARTAAKVNADMLGIPVPDIVLLGKNDFPSETARSAVSDDGKNIAVNRDIPASDIDIWFYLSHEMRHVWQIRSGKFNMQNYSESGTVPLSDYNAQEAEIDAHAWSLIVMAKIFGIRPTLEKNLGTEIWRKITDRAQKITEDRGDHNGKSICNH